MKYVGIDIAKEVHYACIVDDDGVVLQKPFAFNNNSCGLSLFLSKISPFERKDLIVGLESTSHYAANIIQYLLDRDYSVCEINPLSISALRKGNIRNTKTDTVDCLVIAKALMLNDYPFLTKKDSTLIVLRSLCTSRQDLTKHCTAYKIKLHSYVDQMFPELHSCFSKIHGSACYALLKTYCSPKIIVDLKPHILSKFLRKHSHGKCSDDTASQILDCAKTSIGVDNPALAIQIRQTIDFIEFCSNQIAELSKSIANIMETIDSPLKSIPGVGNYNGAIILSFIGKIDRFNSPSELLAFCGLDPVVRQSGKFNAATTRMSKRVNGLFRYGVINAAHNAVKNNETFKKYYDLKISQGKRHYNALGHTAHKLIRVIFKLLSSGIPFDANAIS